MVNLEGWGRHPKVDAELLVARSIEDVAHAVITGGPLTPRGLGRSYGDSSLSERMLDLTGLDHYLAFDEATGSLTAEAGVSLSEILVTFLPKGWFLPVTPGTRFVTLGGAVASDVHGKNHHKDGTFCDHVTSMRILVASGEVLDISRTSHSELFHATCGGMGLTGVILDVTFTLLKVESRSVDETLVKAPNLDAVLESLDDHEAVRYSVAWIDLVASGTSLGRSLVMVGEHSTDGNLEVKGSGMLATMPLDMPSPLLNAATVKVFNTLYYERIRKDVTVHKVGFEPFFYPLDKVGDWNRVYGRQGFLQYQFVLPFGPNSERDEAKEALREIVRRIAVAGLASPLAVLKVFGPENDHLLSFPAAGYTLAIDVKVTPAAFKLCDELDRFVLSAGGRLYLTKDARMSRETFEAGYPRLSEFEKVRQQYGATGVFVSAQSRRLGLA